VFEASHSCSIGNCVSGCVLQKLQILVAVGFRVHIAYLWLAHHMTFSTSDSLTFLSCYYHFNDYNDIFPINDGPMIMLSSCLSRQYGASCKRESRVNKISSR
jgi:hypothetical protein